MNSAFPGSSLRTAAIAGLLTLAPAVGAEDWPLYGFDHGNTRYSALTQVNRATVGTLQRQWVFQTGIKASFQASLVVADGVMFVSTPFDHALALDAATGEQRWRYDHNSRVSNACCGPANRGVAVAHGMVFLATVDARVVALDQAAGQVRWDVPLVDAAPGAMEQLGGLSGVPELEGAHQTGQTDYSANMAPQVVDDLVFVGVTGAGYGLHVEHGAEGKQSMSVVGLGGEQLGLRGFIVALDAATGAERWRWYSVPDSNWAGAYVAATAYGVPLNRNLEGARAPSARYAEAWRFGGGSVWTTPAIDRELGLLFVGTGNPAPQMDDATRPGDNLHTISLVALDLKTGKLVWAYQQVPHDRWGYDVESPAVLFELHDGTQKRQVVGEASKTSWFFVHDRRTGELVYRSQPFAPQENLFTPPTEAGVRITPSGLGACSWSPVAVDASAGYAYVAGSHAPARYVQRRIEPKAGQPSDSFTLLEPLLSESHGLLSAIDLATGKLAWQQTLPKPMVGGVLATAGGSVFAGQGTGEFAAYDTRNGARLWHDQHAAGVNAPPITYAIAGRQYVAVAGGGNSLYGYPVGDEVVA